MSIERLPNWQIPNIITADDDTQAVKDMAEFLRIHHIEHDEESANVALDFEKLVVDTIYPTNIEATTITTTNLTSSTSMIISSLTDGYVPYHVNDTTGLANSNIFYDGTNVGIGLDAATRFEIGSTDASNRMSLYHNNTDAYFKWDDGRLILETAEGTNTDTEILVQGKGTGASIITSRDEYPLLINPTAPWDSSTGQTRSVSFFSADTTGGAIVEVHGYTDGQTGHASPDGHGWMGVLSTGDFSIQSEGDSGSGTGDDYTLNLGLEGRRDLWIQKVSTAKHAITLIDLDVLTFTNRSSPTDTSESLNRNYSIGFNDASDVDLLSIVDGQVIDTNVRMTMDSTGLFSFYEGIKMYGYVTAGTADRYTHFQMDDTNDEFYIQAENNANHEGITIDLTETNQRFRLRQNSDIASWTLDGPDLIHKWSDGSLVLQTDEGTDTVTILHLKPKGNANATIYLGDRDGSNYADFSQSDGATYISSATGDLLRINISNQQNVTFFEWATTGNTPELIIGGYRTSDSLRLLEIGVGVDAADTASFDGLSNYLFDGDIQAGNATLGTIGCNEITVADGHGINLQEDITFTGATTENFINMPVDLLDALSIQEGSNKYVTFDTITNEEDILIYKSVDILHTSTHADDHALEIDTDAANYGDVKAIDLDYITGSISMGQDEGIILININEIAAGSGADVFGLEVLSTDGSANIHGMKVGPVVHPIHQDSGSFINATFASDNTPDSDVDVMRDGLTTPVGKTTAIFENDNEYIIIGADAAFQDMELIFTTVSSKDIKPTFWYSIDGGSDNFTQFTPVDGTGGCRHTGVISWDASDLTNHVADDTTGKFDIKIIRTKGGTFTTPVLGYAKTATTVEYVWDQDGDVNIRNLSIISGGTIGCTGDANLLTLTANTCTVAGTVAATTITGTNVTTGADPGHTHTAYQASDATLAALAAYNTNGLLTQTAADTFAGRTIIGTANEIDVANGNGVAGNPTLSLPATIIVDVTGDISGSSGSCTGESATVATITGLPPDTATTQATQGAITSLGTLSALNISGAIATPTTITTSSSIYLGDTSNAFMTQGLTINQSGCDDEVLCFKSDISHGDTGNAESDTYATIKKNHANLGGLQFKVYYGDISAGSSPIHDYAIGLLTITGNCSDIWGTRHQRPTITAASALTVDRAATLYVNAAPLASGSATITDSYALWVDAGIVRLDGLCVLQDTYHHDMNGETIRDLQINDSGELGYDSSTIRKKTNITDMEDTSWLYDLRPVNYYPKANSKMKRWGLVAEEVEEVKDEFCFYDKEGQVEGIHKKEFVFPVLNEVQRHEIRIKALEAEVEELRAQIN